MNNELFENYKRDFLSALREADIHEGDVVYVGSDIAGVIMGAIKELELRGKAEQNAFLDGIIDTLKTSVGEEGTLLFPVYSWDFCRGKGFDYYKTKGEVGAFNNYILENRKDFIRTKHPLYSFMVWGKDAAKLAAMDYQEAWGEASIFVYMHENKAKELDLNVDALRSMTFKHYVEQSVKVPYRYPKFFLGKYTDENGVTEMRSYSMYVRDLSVEMKSTQTTEFFNNAGVGKTVAFRGWNINVVYLDQAYDVIKDCLVNHNGENIYSFENYKIDWNADSAKERYEVGFLKDRSLAAFPEDLK